MVYIKYKNMFNCTVQYVSPNVVVIPATWWNISSPKMIFKSLPSQSPSNTSPRQLLLCFLSLEIKFVFSRAPHKWNDTFCALCVWILEHVFRWILCPGISLEGMMLKLKLQYFGHIMWRVDSLEKTLMLGGIGGRRKRGWKMMRWLDGITDSMDWVWVNSWSWWWTGRPGVLQFMRLQRVGHDWATDLIWSVSLGWNFHKYFLKTSISV